MGIAAPIAILLLRMIQGFSTGGEYGGAATFIAEYSPAKRRGFFGSLLEFGTLAGYVLGNLVVLVVTLSLSRPTGGRLGLADPVLRRAAARPGRSLPADTSWRTRPRSAAWKRGQGGRQGAAARRSLRNWRMILNLIGIVLLLNVADYRC